MEGKVIIYTTPDCPFCYAAKEDLKKRSIEYREIDVAQNPEAEEKVVQIAGKRVVPVIVEGEKVTVGFKGV
jgi:glutaredoxin